MATTGADKAGAKAPSSVTKGKRRTPRRPRSLEVTCRGTSNSTYAGRTVDLSRGGVQVEFEGGRWTVPVETDALGVFTEVLRGHLPDGFEVSFGLGIVRARATIVRVIPVARKGAPLRVGLRFDPELSPEDAHRLGLGMSGDEDVPRTPRGGPRTALAMSGPGVQVRLTPTRTPQHPSAPQTVGRLVEVQAHGLTLEFVGREPTELPSWVRRSGAEIRLRCVSGTRVLWASMANVSKSSLTDAGLLRLLVLAKELPPKSVRTAMEKERASAK